MKKTAREIAVEQALIKDFLDHFQGAYAWSQFREYTLNNYHDITVETFENMNVVCFEEKAAEADPCIQFYLK